jgi:hypothetical protein
MITGPRKPSGAVGSRGGPWNGLYKAGGVSALAFVALTVADIVLAIVAPPVPASGGAEVLSYIGAHPALYIVFQSMFVGPVGFIALTFLALYAALEHVDRSTAAIAVVTGIISVILCLFPFSFVNGLAFLGGQYAAAATDAQRAAYVSAAEGLLAQNNAVSVGGIIFAVGILLFSLVMLKGKFGRTVAWIGIAAGVIGIVCESLRPVMGAAYAIYMVVFVWCVMVGVKLCRMGWSSR